MQPLDGIENRAARIEVEGVAKLVGLGCRHGLDARRQVPCVVAPGAAATDRAEQVAERAIAEKVQRLVGHLEGDGSGIVADPAAGTPPEFALLVEVRRRRDEALLHHPLDDLLNEILDLLAGRFLVAVSRLTEQPLQRLLGQHAAVEERFENRVVQRLHRAVLVAVRRIAPGIAEPARQQHVGQLRDEIVDVDLVEQVACIFCVPIFHRNLSFTLLTARFSVRVHVRRFSCNIFSSRRPWAPAYRRSRRSRAPPAAGRAGPPHDSRVHRCG